jgi:flagellar assembly protein FliH
MTHFQKYDFQDLSAPSAREAPQVAPYQETKFDLHRDVDAAEAIARKAAGFRLDRLVSSQLGLEERERKLSEEQIRKEIEKRWEQTAEKAEVAGYTKGLDEGKQEAYRAELPRIQEKVERLDALLHELSEAKERIFAANEAFLLDLIARVAGQVALKEVSLDPDYIRRLVTGLLHQVGSKEDLKIFLSPQDMANAQGLFDLLQKEFGKLSNTHIEASEEVKAGGCRIETRFGVVDACLSTQVENMMKSLQA